MVSRSSHVLAATVLLVSQVAVPSVVQADEAEQLKRPAVVESIDGPRIDPAALVAVSGTTPEAPAMESASPVVSPSDTKQEASTGDSNPVVAQAGTVIDGPVLRGGAEVDDITKQIVQKELELMKLNTNLKIEQLPDKWAGRRWSADNLALAGCVATGSYMNGTQRLRFQRKPTKISKYFFANAGWTRMIGSWVIVGGSMIELSAMAGKHFRQVRHGVDPNTMRKYADGLQNSIDDLLKARDAGIVASGKTGAEREALDSEGLVLRDVRNLAVNEFARFYAQTKGIAASTIAGYTIAGLNNILIATGAIVGNHYLLTTRGTVHQRTVGGGTGGICDTIAGGINMTVPFTTRAIGYVARHSASRSICRQLDCNEPAHLDQLHAHQLQYHALVSQQPLLNMATRDGVFAKEASIFDQHEGLRLGEAKAARHKFFSQLVFFESVGATKVVNGVTTMVGAYKYTNDARLRFQALGAGAITQGIGYSVAGAEVMRNQLWGELRSAKLRKEGRSTGQILHKQLDELSAMSGKG